LFVFAGAFAPPTGSQGAARADVDVPPNQEPQRSDEQYCSVLKLKIGFG